MKKNSSKELLKTDRIISDTNDAVNSFKIFCQYRIKASLKIDTINKYPFNGYLTKRISTLEDNNSIASTNLFRTWWYFSKTTNIPSPVSCITIEHDIISFARGRFESNLRSVIFKLILGIDGWGIPCEIALGLMSSDLTEGKSTLVQVMALCRQATTH